MNLKYLKLLILSAALNVFIAAASNGKLKFKHFLQFRAFINDKLSLSRKTTDIPKFDVDFNSSMKQFTLNILPQEPIVRIYDPNNNHINDYEAFINMTDVPTIKIFKVEIPKPGEWTVQVEATTPYTGQASIISDLSFKYGFALKEPNSMKQASFSPIIGQNNYLAISPSNSSFIRSLKYIVLETKSGPLRFPLRKKTGSNYDLYLTEPIQLPNETFKVVLHGIGPEIPAIKRSSLPHNKSLKINVQEGEPIYLICGVISMGNISISWWKVGQHLALKSMKSMQSNILNHTIAESKISDGGEYICVANNSAGVSESKMIVDVRFPFKTFDIIVKLDNRSEILNKSTTRLDIFNITTISLTCMINGNPPPATKWEKNGVILLSTRKLLINTAKPGFSGTYKCSTQNELNSDERAIELVEINKPKLRRFSSEQNLIENKEFRLTCPVEPGDYDVTWYFNNNNFDKHKQSDGSLFIEKVYTNMKGRAYCVATNKAGTAVATFNFDVLRPPYGLSVTTSSYKNRIQTISPNLKQITLIKDEPLDITCNARGNPNPNIFWMKNHRLYSRDKTIEIRSVVPTDGATYICVAQNTLGNQTEKIDVIVRIPPSLLTNNVNKLGVTVLQRVQVPNTYFKADNEQLITTNEGENVLLDCNMDGNSRVTVNWFKNNLNLLVVSTILEFTSARIENSGIYKCIDGNSSGIIFYLNVQKPISIISATSTRNVYEKGDEIKLICRTKGNQLPIIVWRGNGYATDNENIFKPNNEDLRKQALQQDEPLYLNGKQIIKLSDVGPLERYGMISYEFIDGEYIGTLEYVIKSAKLQDSGEYRCISRIYKMKNTQIIKSVKIKVVEAPYLENAQTEYKILEGIGSHKIKCPIKGMPYPNIEWYRGASAIISNQHFDVQTNYLVFKNPLVLHSGEYSCRGINIGGSTEFKFQVIIFKHITNKSKAKRSLTRRIEVEKNNFKELECSFKITPIYWSEIVDAYPNKYRKYLMANATYNFYADTSKDIMCSNETDSEYGEIFEITVLEKPTIWQPNKINVQVELDYILRLQCDATGEPKPTIKWYKYKRGHLYNIEKYSQFEVYGETLIKRRAEYTDTAKYLCTAQNKLGTDSHIFNVTVIKNRHYFSPWSDWSKCTKTCGQGTKFKIRYCIHSSCYQKPQRIVQMCKIAECPVDGGWSDFSPFGECSKTCRTNFNEPRPIRIATRECNNPTPANGGKNCKGSPKLIVKCSVPLCKTEGCKQIDKCKIRGPYRRNPNCMRMLTSTRANPTCGLIKCYNTRGSYESIKAGRIN